MFCIVNIYRGALANQGHEGFLYTTKGYKQVCGVLYSGSVSLSIAFNNGHKLLIRGLEMDNQLDVQPNRRPFFFNQPVELETICGVVKIIKVPEIMIVEQSKPDVSIYLLLK